jgi:hypothetical protein
MRAMAVGARAQRQRVANPRLAAVELYRRTLRPNGVMLFHVSNCHHDLPPAIVATAESPGLSEGPVLTDDFADLLRVLNVSF